MNNFSFFSLGQIISKMWIIKFEVFCNIEMKYGLNIISTKLFTQQVGWFGGKGVDFHPWGFKDQISQMTFIVINIKISKEYFLPS